MTATALAPAIPPPTDTDPGIFHLWCCDQDTAMCGTDITGLPVTDGDDEQDCVVCLELDEQTCPKCGLPPE